MGSNVNQRNVTRNQSTADYTRKEIFLFDNRYAKGTLTNNSDPEVAWTAKSGQLVYRQEDGTLSLEGTAGDIVGILTLEEDVTLAANESLSVDFCSKGTVNGNEILDLAGDALDLDAVITGLMLRDYLERLGLHIDSSSVEHTKFDN